MIKIPKGLTPAHEKKLRKIKRAKVDMAVRKKTYYKLLKKENMLDTTRYMNDQDLEDRRDERDISPHEYRHVAADTEVVEKETDVEIEAERAAVQRGKRHGKEDVLKKIALASKPSKPASASAPETSAAIAPSKPKETYAEKQKKYEQKRLANRRVFQNKTSKGQPVMSVRINYLLDKIKASQQK